MAARGFTDHNKGATVVFSGAYRIQQRARRLVITAGTYQTQRWEKERQKMVLSYKKEELIAALNALRPKFVALDAKAKAKHKKDEDAYLKAWRAALKKASGWSYGEAKKNRFDLPRPPDGYSWSRGPTCPKSLVAALDAHIARVKASGQARYRIRATGWTRGLYATLTYNMPKDGDLCEK